MGLSVFSLVFINFIQGLAGRSPFRVSSLCNRSSGRLGTWVNTRRPTTSADVLEEVVLTRMEKVEKVPDTKYICMLMT